MRHREHRALRKPENHPVVSFGIFLIVLGIALLIATNDWLNLGSVGDYFNWKTVMIFIGFFLILNLEFTWGILMIAAGIWFFREELFPFDQEKFNIFFWPAVIGLIGLSFILSGFIKRIK